MTMRQKTYSPGRAHLSDTDLVGLSVPQSTGGLQEPQRPPPGHTHTETQVLLLG